MLKATVYCNHLFVNFTKAFLKLFMEMLRGRKLSSLICRGLNHNNSLSSRMESKCTNYKANKCAKLLLQEVSIWAYYNGRWSLRACSCPFHINCPQQERTERDPVFRSQSVSLNSTRSHLKRADWIFLVYCGLLFWIAVSSCKGGGVARCGELGEAKLNLCFHWVQCLAPCINCWPTPKGLQSRNYLTPEESGN